MKITLDHNCIIDLANGTPTGIRVKAIAQDPQHRCFVVNIGASEMRQRGVDASRYDKFEELLKTAGIGHLPRLDPLAMFDITFWDHGIWANDADVKLSDEIEVALFGARLSGMPPQGLDSPEGKRWLNRLCDAHSLWAHIRNGNDVFLTSDRNFTKATKLPALIKLGAGRLCAPEEL